MTGFDRWRATARHQKLATSLVIEATAEEQRSRKQRQNH